MIIYHGHAREAALEKCKEAAPNLTHGLEFGRYMWLNDLDVPYIIDNGAFSAYDNGNNWDPTEFLQLLAWANERDREPDFVIIPDVVGDASGTIKRSSKWAKRISFTKYQPVQDGMGISEGVDLALNNGASGIFIGGSVAWKKKTASEWVDAAHESGLKAHIGRPGGVKGILAARRWGADSVDTVTIVRNRQWEKLRTIENQRTLFN